MTRRAFGLSLLSLSISLSLSLPFSSAAVRGGEGLRVDIYGQVIGDPESIVIKDDDQLRAEARAEADTLAQNGFDPQRFDRFGGRLDAGDFEATGRFRLRKIDGRWWFITPEGHRYFAIGCDAADFRESGYSSPVFDADGKNRAVFTQLPDPEAHPEAYSYQGKKVSLLARTLRAKYGPGPDFIERVRETTRRRLLAWGFNSTAKWGWANNLGLPYIDDANLDVRRFDRYIDMFDPDFPARAEASIARQITRCVDDPMLIAYSTENENGWNRDAIANLAADVPDSPGKAALVDHYIKRYGEADAAVRFGAAGRGRAGMLENRRKTFLDDEAATAFIRIAARRYHEIVGGIYKRLDPAGLWFGAAHCTAQSDAWMEEALAFTDAVLFNEYAVDAAWSSERIRLCVERDKPFFISEFSFVGARAGRPLYQVLNTVKDDRARGLAYRHYTEKLAASPYCVGFGYFILYDQPVTMRSLPNGECFNFGLVGYQDRPYGEMLAEVKKSNARLDGVHAGGQAPFAVDDWRALLADAPENEFTAPFLRASTSPFVNIDRAHPERFDGLPRRLKIQEGLNPAPGDYAVGILDCRAPERRTPVALVYLWKGRRGESLDLRFGMEGSADGKEFAPLAVAFQRLREGENDAYEMFPAEPLPDGIGFVRILLRNPEPAVCWSNQYAGLSWKRSEPAAAEPTTTLPKDTPADTPKRVD